MKQKNQHLNDCEKRKKMILILEEKESEKMQEVTKNSVTIFVEYEGRPRSTGGLRGNRESGRKIHPLLQLSARACDQNREDIFPLSITTLTRKRITDSDSITHSKQGGFYKRSNLMMHPQSHAYFFHIFFTHTHRCISLIGSLDSSYERFRSNVG